MTGRFDKFTERARRTLQLAQEEAQRFNHNYIGTEHILLGILRVEDCMAAGVLKSLGIELNKVRSAVEFIIGRGDRPVMSEVALTEKSKRAIELAADEARRLNHHYIGTEHLLLGILREGRGMAAGILESLGVSLERARAATLDVLQASQPGGETPLRVHATTDRFDKFTERARRTLQLAQEEAQRFNHKYIGTEHILLGLVREGDGVAARALNSLGIDLGNVRSSVEFIIGRGERMVMGEIGLTPRSKRVIEFAVDEARRLNHHYIGTEHLLLGLVREGEGIAAGVLESLGVSLEKARAATLAALRDGQRDDGQPSGERAEPNRFDRFTQRTRHVLRLAEEEARRFEHSYVGSEHILLGLLRESDGLAARLLGELDIDSDKARAAIESLVGKVGRDPGLTATGDIGMSEEGMRVLQFAAEESRRFKHGYVGTEHLLLGVLRETEGIGATVLSGLAVSLDKVRFRLIELLGSPGGQPTFSTEVIVIPKVPDDEPRDQPDVFELKLGNSVHFRAGFLRYEQAPPEDLMLLHGWLALEFQLASAGHVDASFLDLLRTAVNSAQRLKRDYIGADNLLDALREENSAALRLFTQHGASAAMGPDRSRDDLGSRPFTLEALRIIELALEEARSAGVKAAAEHLLLGIMLEGTSTAYQALAAAGITADEVRALIKGDTAGSSE